MALASLLTEKAFVERRYRDWEELDTLTTKATTLGSKKLTGEEVSRLSPLYRNVCADLAAAQAARYSAPLVDHLRDLTATSHSCLYGRDSRSIVNDPQRRTEDARAAVGRAWLVAFPRAVRARWRAMILATGLFFLPFALGLVLAMNDTSFAFRVVPEAMLRQLTEAYAKGFSEGRAVGDGSFMAGFYVYNNVGIALRCFALGVFGGIGSAFYLVQNGLFTGAVVGYVASQGAGFNIFTFIFGHGSLELGAIVLAGGAGLSLGWSIIAPGDLPRVASLQRTAREVVVIVGGAAVMLFMAAGVEAFWSASSVPSPVKIGVGALLFVLVLTYVLVAGRGGAERAT